MNVAAPKPEHNAEWHVTVAGDPMRWHRWLTALDALYRPHLGVHIKPLYIELNNFERQLMCAANFNPSAQIMEAGFRILRVKHELRAEPNTILEHYEEQGDGCRLVAPHYYECHVKFNGYFLPWLPWSSRDLFRTDRWYLTKRSRAPFDPGAFADWAANAARTSLIDSYEYEAAVIDTCPDLDTGWGPSLSLPKVDVSGHEITGP